MSRNSGLRLAGCGAWKHFQSISIFEEFEFLQVRPKRNISLQKSASVEQNVYSSPQVHAAFLEFFYSVLAVHLQKALFFTLLRDYICGLRNLFLRRNLF
jgi:hypothetical protein